MPSPSPVFPAWCPPFVKRILSPQKDDSGRCQKEAPPAAQAWREYRATEPKAAPQRDALVSVIVPIYNVSEYLEQCLTSILVQTHENLEVICVNDGSTDDSLKIIRSFERQDKRIKVIDKPNAGYGHAVNRGIEAAQGTWIAIVEPDDFIDARMYDELLAHAIAPDGWLADVVKSSYWQYFDAGEGTTSRIEKPSLGTHMPTQCKEIKAFDDCEVVRHHPSIWSAIYRKEFLEAFHIRMVEAPGAGWTDGPWLFETMLQAQAVMWVPAAYYYYRLSNPNASSVLRDYRPPFDRLREIRGIYERLGITHKPLVCALYERTLNNIMLSILDRSGFDESEEELYGLIVEAFASMDPAILYEDENGISLRCKEYHRDVMGLKLREVATHAASEIPRVSVVLPLHNDREGLWPTLLDLMGQDFEDFEVLCYDCDSHDRAARIVSDVARIDARVRLVPFDAQAVADGFNQGMADARGEATLFLRPGVRLGSKSFLSALVDGLFGEDRPEANACVGVPGGMDRTASFAALAAAAPLGVYACAYRTRWLRKSALCFASRDDEDGSAFLLASLLKARETTSLVDARVKTELRDELSRRSFADERDLVAFEKTRLDTLADAHGEFAAYGELDALRVYVLRQVWFALSFMGRFGAGEKYYSMLRDVLYDEKLRVLDAPKDVAGCLDVRTDVEEAFWGDYDAFIAAHYGEAMRKRASLEKSIEVIRGTGSYKLSRKISKIVKTLDIKKVLA